MKSLIAAALFILFFFSACTKPGTDGVPGGLTAFEVRVLQRVPVSAIIEWDGVVNLNMSNSDTVKYKIYLNNRLVDSNLLRRRDTLTGLSGDTLYNGKVIAYTRADTVSAPFVLHKINELIVFNSEDLFEVYNAYAGVRLWNKPWHIYTYSDGAPTISHDTVFFSNSNLAGTNTVYAAHLKTGVPIWSAVPPVPGDVSLARGTGPVYNKGQIIVTGTKDIRALNSVNGQTLWSYPQENYSLGTTPVCAGNKIFAGGQYTMVALNESNGSKAWEFPTGQTSKRPLVTDRLLIFGVNKKVIALDQQTGAVAWQRTMTEETFNILPVLADDLVIFFVAADGVYAVNKNTGATVWKRNVWASYVSVASGDGKFFYYDYSLNKLFALDAKTGNQLWERSNLNPTISSGVSEMVYANHSIYCGVGITMYGVHGILAVINGATGAQVNRTLSYSDVISKPTIKINDTVYYTADHGNFR